MRTRARKSVVDSAGVETIVPLHDWVEIGVSRKPFDQVAGEKANVVVGVHERALAAVRSGQHRHIVQRRGRQSELTDITRLAPR